MEAPDCKHHYRTSLCELQNLLYYYIIRFFKHWLPWVVTSGYYEKLTANLSMLLKDADGGIKDLMCVGVFVWAYVWTCVRLFVFVAWCLAGMCAVGKAVRLDGYNFDVG